MRTSEPRTGDDGCSQSCPLLAPLRQVENCSERGMPLRHSGFGTAFHVTCPCAKIPCPHSGVYVYVHVGLVYHLYRGKESYTDLSNKSIYHSCGIPPCGIPTPKSTVSSKTTQSPGRMQQIKPTILDSSTPME